MAGLTLNVPVTVIMILTVSYNQDLEIEPIILISVFVSGFIGLLVLMIYTYSRSPFAVILQIKKDIGIGSENKLLMSTPLTSNEIFLSECLPYGVRGMDLFVPFAIFVAGMVYANLWWLYIFRGDLNFGVIFDAGLTLVIVVILLTLYIILVYHNIYTSIIAGSHAYYEFYAAILLTELRVLLTIAASFIVISFFVGTIGYFLINSQELYFVGLTELIVISPLIIALQSVSIVLASEEGASVFERNRRIESDEEYNKRIEDETGCF
ncbi:MAG: hypothetical protein NTY09_15475 [bacterium]|nr:hypothetical protein [bacterium]